MAHFEDYFSQHASVYAQYRPHYPETLFSYLASISPDHHRAWDCGTGNGQAAKELVNHFKYVVATDASAKQIAQALPHERINYWVGQAEAMSLCAGSVALVTVAIAVHWFDLDRFYQEVQRVLMPDGILAVWTYHLPIISSTLDRVLEEYYKETLAGFWPERIRYIDEHYTALPFPFTELDAPPFEMTANWDLGQLVGFLNSWSATRRYEQMHGENPIKQIWQALGDAWGEPESKLPIRWPLYMRIGRLR